MRSDLVGRVCLERPSERRERDFIEAALRSRTLHRGFVVVAANPVDYRDYLDRVQRDDRAAFLVVKKGSNDLAGVVEINDIVRGAVTSGRLGYYAFVPHAGTGLMREGVTLAIGSAFRDLAFDCLDASVQASNRRSIALLKALGFMRDGTSERRYKVGTRWLNHERWALRAECRRAH